MEHNFYTVCVNSCFVKQAHERLHVDNKSDVKVCAVVGFPLGGMSSEAKVRYYTVLFNWWWDVCVP